MTVPEHTTILAVERDRAISALVSDALVAWRGDRGAGAGTDGAGVRDGEAGASWYDVHRADTSASAVAAIGTVRPDVVVVAAELVFDGGVGGWRSMLFDVIRESAKPAKIIVIADGEDRALAAEAIDLGAFDYCVGPVRAGEFSVLLQRALHIRELEAGMEDLPGRLSGVERFENLVGSCDAMRSVFSAVQKVAVADAGVLLVGESGTGRQLIARAIHHLSARRDGPFVVANSAGAAPELMEQVVFGWRSASGGDTSGRVAGLLEQADGGTLLLEGVCSLPQSLQTRLSAFLRERASHPDVRIVATTDHLPRCGLPVPAGEGSPVLREDLYYRLGVVTIELPPLRERGEDIAIMARAFLAKYSAEHGRTVSGFSRSATGSMMSHAWPGNIAELEARVRRAVILSRGRLVSAADLGLNGNGRSGERSLAEARSRLERSMVTDALLQAAGNVSMAARAIGVSRPTMYDLIRKHELDLSE
ncbi:MAG: sigma-54 dependent transcriptional regulator, partial [Candidatus Eisenbacteria bacterium]